MGVPQPAVGLGVQSVVPDRLLEGGDRLRGPLVRQVQVADLEMDAGAVRLEAQGLLVRRQRLGVPPLLGVQIANPKIGNDHGGADGERGLEFGNRLVVALARGQQVSELHVRRRELRIRLQRPLVGLEGLGVLAHGQMGPSETERGEEEIGLQAERLLERLGRLDVALLGEVDVPQAEVRHGGVGLLRDGRLELLDRLGVLLLAQIEVADDDARLGPLPHGAQPGDRRLAGFARLVRIGSHVQEPVLYGIGCSEKNFSITSFEMSFVVLPMYQVMTGLPPGQEWPPPSMRQSPTAVPSAQCS